ncbi:MAG: ABC transporter ATP-binding protein [Ignavibacteria bacterium]|nr:MAG: ABC transporter ATP-binding protein [Ignavibacteria bacterium]
MRNLYTLKKYFVRYKKKLFLGFIFILLSNAGSVYVPLLLKDSINALQQNTSESELLKYGMMIVGASLFAGFFRFLIRETIIVVSREIEFDLRKDFWAHIQKLPLRYFQNTSTGNIMAHATNDINAVRMFLGPAVMYSTDTFIRLMIVLTIMILLNVELTMFALLPLPFLSIVVFILGKKIHQKFTLIQEKFSELTTIVQENFSGIRVIKAYVREENESEKYAENSKDYLNKKMSLVRVQALIMPILFMITGISTIIVIWLGGIKVINGEMSLGEMTAFIVYLGILIWPMIAVGWVINIVQQAEASMKRVNNILAQPYEIEDNENTDYSIANLRGNIEFKNVSFRYNEHLPEIIKNINLKIPGGTSLAIMGYTGSGKTSFINLIPRLYDCTEGEVLIDGYNVKTIPLGTLRTNIGMVQQEPFLFSDSVINNISYGLKEIDEKRVKKVAEIANFAKDVEQFPHKYETVVGERGITFSGGQKQRCSLARALAINPQILILDDSFSSIDTHTEEEILNNLKEYLDGKTSIIISHRISTVKDADNIIVLDEGKIAEQGTHDELITLEGIYADLHFKQMLEKELTELN